MQAWTKPKAAGVRLGDLFLQEKVGQGSVGEVWKARHTRHCSTVAVKFLMARRLCDPWAVGALENELRTAAGIQHPSIIQILDHAHLSTESSIASGGLLRPLTPYLVLEWVAGGSLRPLRGKLAWSELRPILLQLLDALATSHSRGVIHRDIKPSNILLRSVLTKGNTRVLLTDFGISQAVNTSAGLEGSVAGTPAYMAPEQLHGHLFDQGPWTDLFALGCTAWALSCGSPPFGSMHDLKEITHAQLVLEPPPFHPSHPMPAGFESWLRRLLSKEISSRYIRAADAEYALRSLGGVDLSSGPVLRPVPASQSVPRLTPETTRFSPRSQAKPEAPPHWGASPVVLPPARLPLLPVLRPPISTRAPRPVQRRWAPPPEMSPDLIRRRPLPLIGRDSAKETLWKALGRVLDRGRMQLVQIEGESGNGCTHLARWLCEEAHRGGIATPILGLDTPEPGGPAGILMALRAWLRLSDLSPVEQESRLRAQLNCLSQPGAHDVEVLSGLFNDPHSSLLTFDSTQSRALYRLCLSLTRGPGPERPLVLHLDEAQWATPTIQLLIGWLSQQALRPLPLLALLVVRSQARDTAPVAQAALTRISSSPASQTLRLRPLDPKAQETLFSQVLGLDQALAQELKLHSQGNPAYAIELVNQWIEGGELLSGPHGLKRLDPLAPIRIHTPRQVWVQRVERLLQGLDQSNRHCIEVAATLGLGFNRKEWLKACVAGGLHPSPGLSHSLVRRGLWESREDGHPVRFTHPMLQACILHEAQATGRLSRHHLACAQVLQASRPFPSTRSSALARHLLSSGQPYAALPYLRATTARMVKALDLAGAERQLRRHAAVLEICPRKIPQERIAADLLRAKIALIRAQSIRARQLLEWSLHSAAEEGQEHLEARARLDLCELHIRDGRPLSAWRHALRGGELLESIEDRDLCARLEVLKGRVCMLTGRTSRALVHFASAHSWWAETDDPEAPLQAFIALGELALYRGQTELAFTHLRVAARAAHHREELRETHRVELLQIRALYLAGDLKKARSHLRRWQDTRSPTPDESIEGNLLALTLEMQPTTTFPFASPESLKAQLEAQGPRYLLPLWLSLESRKQETGAADTA